MLLEILVLGLFPAAMAFAAASDLVSMTISNRVSLALIIGFFLVAWLTGMGLADVGRHLLAGVVVLAVAFGFFAAGWIGGGDAKLAAATALWLGFSHLMEYLLIASIAGGILTLVLLQLRTLPMPAIPVILENIVYGMIAIWPHSGYRARRACARSRRGIKFPGYKKAPVENGLMCAKYVWVCLKRVG